MSKLIFSAGCINSIGICHAIACKWIKESLNKSGGVKSITELGHIDAMIVNYEIGESASWKKVSNCWQQINQNYHLKTDNIKRLVNPDKKEIIKSECKGLNGSALIILWNKDYLKGHTVAIIRNSNIFQYFDPNVGAIEFTDLNDFNEWMDTNSNSPFKLYPELLNGETELVRV